MVRLRQLNKKDAPFMIEWMHDEETKKYFQTDFASMTINDVENFVENSFNEESKNFAIVDEEYEEYLGTISLKNIDYKNRNAEYAISTRKKCRGTGINTEATKQLLNYAFNELYLNKVYLNVLSSNIRAISFYKKIGFKYEGTAKSHVLINNEYMDLEWYGIINEQI